MSDGNVFLYPIDIFYIEIIKKFFKKDKDTSFIRIITKKFATKENVTNRRLQVETGIVYSEILCNQCSQWKLTNVNHSNPLQVEQF